MIKTFVAHTYEIDDVEAAVAEVLSQLHPEERLLAHSVGVIACHYEYVFSGVTEALSRALPFDVTGTITSAQAVPGDSGSLLLTLMVLTSDDAVFKTVLTEPLIGAPREAIENAYARANMGMGKPGLIFTFAAFLVENSGDDYVETITKASGGAPCFGTIAVDDTSTFESSFMIYNGVHYRDRMAMILIYGDVKPRFYVTSISRSKVLDKAALITSSDKHILKEVNGRPLAEFFDSIGLKKASETSYALTSLPFMLDYGDGTPLVSKIFIGMNENGEGICAGNMPEGAALYFGVLEKDDVLLTTRKIMEETVKDAAGASGMLIYSCVSRFMSLGAGTGAELEAVRGGAGALPFMAAYSGGEICPTQTGATAVNRFHNNSFIACVF